MVRFGNEGEAESRKLQGKPKEKEPMIRNVLMYVLSCLSPAVCLLNETQPPVSLTPVHYIFERVWYAVNLYFTH